MTTVNHLLSVAFTVCFIYVYFTVSSTDVQADFLAEESLWLLHGRNTFIYSNNTVSVLGVCKAGRAAPSAGADITRDLFPLLFCQNDMRTTVTVKLLLISRLTLSVTLVSFSAFTFPPHLHLSLLL